MFALRDLRSKSLVLLLFLCAELHAILLPGPNTTDLSQVPGQGIFLHFSRGASKEDVSSQFNVYYLANDANGTLGKRDKAENPEIRCDGEFIKGLRPRRDPVASQWAPFGTLERPATAPPLTGPSTDYATERSWCDPNRAIRGWICQRTPQNSRSQMGLNRNRYDLGRCADDEVCVNSTMGSGPRTYARCFQQKLIAQQTIGKSSPSSEFI